MKIRKTKVRLGECLLQAVAAFEAFMQQYGRQTSSAPEKYLAALNSSNRPIRRGSTLGLGALPFYLLQPRAKDILLGLAAATKVSNSSGVGTEAHVPVLRQAAASSKLWSYDI